MRTIAITINKGGVGKTTLTKSIATAATAAGFNVLVFPCSAIDYGNQYGDYEGLASFGGISHPVWTDSRDQLSVAAKKGTRMAAKWSPPRGAVRSEPFPLPRSVGILAHRL
jgi:Mrp family chromosome partitioning ATPase